MAHYIIDSPTDDQPMNRAGRYRSQTNGSIPVIEEPEQISRALSPEANAPGARWGNQSNNNDPNSGVPRLAKMQNRSTPVLRNSSHSSIEGLPYDYPPEQEQAPEVGLASLTINDPVQRTGTSNSYRDSDHQRRRMNGPPPSRSQFPQEGNSGLEGYDTSSLYSRSSSGYESDRLPYGRIPQNHPSMRRPPPPAGYAPPARGPPSGWAPPQSQQPYPPHNPLLTAASDVLGLGPPPGQTPIGYSVSAPNFPPPDRQQYPTSSNGSLAPYPVNNNGSGVMRSASSVSSMQRPDFQRAAETAGNFPSLKTQKKKAIDVTAPPYTKEYVEEYRARIKGDPDPESHFAFAKYLIDAAKKIGSDAQDQRAMRKYRDSLITEALKVIRRLATQGETYSEAQFFLANCHGTGMLGLQVDHERAFHLYLQAAKQNHPSACYRVGVCNDIGAGTKKDPPRAFMFYRKAASLGETAAMYKLGLILIRGELGQQPNPREAVQWLKRAAEQADEENPHALSLLASLHEQQDNDAGVIYDPAYAVDLYTKAGHLGHVQSQRKLGSCYESGTLGCPIDPRKSIAWYSKAAEKGDSEAELCLSGWYLTGAEGVLKQSDSEAYLWARRAANRGWPRAEYAVGYYAEVGIGVQQDMELSKRWYMRAAAQGNKRAMARLTELKRLGNKRSVAARPTRQQHNDENCVIM